jgi:hypothetical protein
VKRPIAAFSHAKGNCSITGGYVYRGRSARKLRGRYVYADFCRGQIRSLVASTGGASGDRDLGPRLSNLSSIATGRRDRVYLTSLQGDVYRLDPRMDRRRPGDARAAAR